MFDIYLFFLFLIRLLLVILLRVCCLLFFVCWFVALFLVLFSIDRFLYIYIVFFRCVGRVLLVGCCRWLSVVYVCDCSWVRFVRCVLFVVCRSLCVVRCLCLFDV